MFTQGETVLPGEASADFGTMFFACAHYALAKARWASGTTLFTQGEFLLESQPQLEQ
jgi:hypothetical protein